MLEPFRPPGSRVSRDAQREAAIGADWQSFLSRVVLQGAIEDGDRVSREFRLDASARLAYFNDMALRSGRGRARGATQMQRDRAHGSKTRACSVSTGTAQAD